MKANKFARVIKRALLYLFEIFIFIFTVFPFFWIVVSSFKGAGEIFASPPTILPEVFTLENYRKAIFENDLLVFAKNSIIIGVSTTFLAVLIAALAAYGIGFLKISGSKFMTIIMVVTQMFPIVVLIIPLFTLCSKFGLLNTYYSLILSNLAITVPSAIIIMSGYFASVPSELGEAAQLDGCNNFKMLTKVILPIVGPGLIAVGIFTFIGVWQEFLLAVSFISDSKMNTLPVGLTSYVGEHSTDWGGLMATSVVIAVPAIILFVSVQKYFIDNLAGSVKG